tara:strand:+ start:1995 stop:3239 length:1245 start_codon:yes stop_codon:yes gene_type:complete
MMQANINNVDSFGNASIDELLSVNDLTYLADNESNVVVERSQKITYSQKTSYNQNEVIILQLNTGSDFVSWLDSSLRILVTPTQVVGNAKEITWGGGSVLNLFKTIRLISRSGVVITEITKLNLWNYFNLKMSHSNEWRTNQQGKKLLGVGVPLDANITNEYVIPLRDICPFFSDDVLSPSVINAGLRIEITMDGIGEMFQHGAANVDLVTNCNVSGIELNLDSYRLSAGAMSALNSMAASSGLVLTFPDLNNSKFAKNAGSTNFSCEVRQAVSMANYVYASIRTTANVSSPNADSFATIAPTDASTYQYRIASIYLPQTAVRGSKQYYSQLSYAQGDMKSGSELGIRDDEADQNALACATIARYSTKGSGMALNNSTSLNFNATVDTVQSDVDVFLMHTKRVVAFLESIVISE